MTGAKSTTSSASASFTAVIPTWRRPPGNGFLPDGPFGARAALQLGMLAMSSGQFTRAEQILQGPAPRARYRHAGVAARLAASVPPRRADRGCAAGHHRILGRVGLAGEVVKQLSRLDAAPSPVETTRQTPGEGGERRRSRLAARANLAIRTGQFRRAAEWLDACARRRPDDSAVWRARLELARATGDLAGAWRGLEHLPADRLVADRPAPAPRLARRADGRLQAERAALSALVELEPGDTAALDRLADPRRRGRRCRGSDTAPVEEIRDAGRPARYRALLQGDSIGDPAELATPRRDPGPPDRGQGLGPDSRSERRTDRDRRGRPLVPPRTSARPTDRRRSDARRALRGPAARHAASVPAGSPGVVPRFVDDAESAGLRFVHENGAIRRSSGSRRP